jgi:hypothetical protein
VGVKARFNFHPRKGPSEPSLPFDVVEKPVRLPDGTVQVRRVKVYGRCPGSGVEPEVRPSCLSDAITLDRRNGTTGTG